MMYPPRNPQTECRCCDYDEHSDDGGDRCDDGFPFEWGILSEP
jgi:hypothetical protein